MSSIADRANPSRLVSDFLFASEFSRIPLLAVLALAFSRPAPAGYEWFWHASSGLLPDQICEPCTLLDSATPEDPILGSQFLTISTSENSENMAYVQTDPMVDTSGSFFIEAAVRFVSGSNIPSRAPIVILFATAPEVGNALYIRGDEVFFNTSNNVKGPSAFVDTDGAFHTYRIDVSDTGSLSLLYDGSPILSGQTFTSAAHNDVVEQIRWGEVSNFATGASEWASFKHNALVAECPPLDYVLTVEYQTPESTGPLIEGFDPLPATITARFTLRDVQPGQTTIGLDQVTSFDLTTPGASPTAGDLDSFQLTRGASGSPQGLTWNANASFLGPVAILNTNFTLEITGTDPLAQQEFRYFWSESDDTFVASPGLTGDYNDDGTVGAADYVAWRKHALTPTPLPNDPLGGVLGHSQYDNWRANFAEPAASGGGGAAPVPEPTTLALALLAVAEFVRIPKRR